MVRSDIAIDAAEFDDKERESLSVSNSGSTKDFPAISELSLEDNGWISPPDSICSSSSESGTTSQDASFPGSFNDQSEEIQRVLQEPSSIKASVDQNSAPLPETDFQEISPFETSESKITEVDNSYEVSSLSATNEHNKHPEPVASQSGGSVTVAPATSHPLIKNSEDYENRSEISSLNKVKIMDGDHESPSTHNGSRVSRGKYGYYVILVL